MFKVELFITYIGPWYKGLGHAMSCYEASEESHSRLKDHFWFDNIGGVMCIDIDGVKHDVEFRFCPRGMDGQMFTEDAQVQAIVANFLPRMLLCSLS